MEYTPEQLRKEAEYQDKTGEPISNDPDLLRAHAAALEERDRYKRALQEIADEVEGPIYDAAGGVMDVGSEPVLSQSGMAKVARDALRSDFPERKEAP